MKTTHFLKLLTLTLVLYFVKGFVLIKLWTWFITPTFHLPQLSIGEATGIVLIARLLHFQGYKEDDTKLHIEAYYQFFVSFLALLLGWIVTSLN